MNLPAPRALAVLSAALVLASVDAVAKTEIRKVDAPPKLVSAPMAVNGRVVMSRDAAGIDMYRFQWPGVYWKSVVEGEKVFLRVGEGKAIYHVVVDDQPPIELMKPAAGVYVVDGLSAGTHQVRVEAVSENQGGPIAFGGIAVPAGIRADAAPRLARRIEFIGDSHTVGYGNTSSKRECPGDGVWMTTDNSQAFGPLTAKHLGAEYRINAISGRGVVRNYNGFAADHLPEAYPYALFDRQMPADDSTWNPQVIVINLGTNDFSTPLNPGEKWKTREELRADYERTYVAFVQSLRAKHPGAFFILAANDGANGEIHDAVRKVIDQLAAAGEKRVGFVQFNGMELTACDWHPSLADHRLMSAAVLAFLEQHPEVWD